MRILEVSLLLVNPFGSFNIRPLLPENTNGIVTLPNPSKPTPRVRGASSELLLQSVRLTRTPLFTSFIASHILTDIPSAVSHFCTLKPLMVINEGGFMG